MISESEIMTVKQNFYIPLINDITKFSFLYLRDDKEIFIKIVKSRSNINKNN